MGYNLYPDVLFSQGQSHFIIQFKAYYVAYINYVHTMMHWDASIMPVKVFGIMRLQKQRAKCWHNRQVLGKMHFQEAVFLHI